MPLVSILIPAYNSGASVAATTRSALDQTWPRKEIIIVDDESRDRTRSAARRIASKQVSAGSRPNQGAAVARNRASSLSQELKQIRMQARITAGAAPEHGRDEAGRPSDQRFALFGLVLRKERWGLSWRGRLIAAGGAVLTAGVIITNIYPFLALTDRVDAKVLVVEGWVHDYAIQASLRELKAGRYERVFATGGPVIGTGGYTSDFNTAASVGADRLKAAGAPSELVQMVPCREVERDRTFSSAVALRDWFQQHHMTVQSLNVITEGAHSRRTRLLFERAFHGRVKIGVVSIPSPDYDVTHWWRSSQGMEEVLEQGFAYLYARLVFNASSND